MRDQAKAEVLRYSCHKLQIRLKHLLSYKSEVVHQRIIKLRYEIEVLVIHYF